MFQFLTLDGYMFAGLGKIIISHKPSVLINEGQKLYTISAKRLIESSFLEKHKTKAINCQK